MSGTKPVNGLKSGWKESSRIWCVRLLPMLMNLVVIPLKKNLAVGTKNLKLSRMIEKKKNPEQLTRMSVQHADRPAVAYRRSTVLSVPGMLLLEICARTYATEASKSTVYQRSTKKYEFRTTPAHDKKYADSPRHEPRHYAPAAAQDLSERAVHQFGWSSLTPARNNAAVQPVPKRLRVAAREHEEQQLKKKTTTAPNPNSSAYFRLRSLRSSSMISSPSIAVNSRRRSMYEHKQHTASSSIIQVEVGGRCSSPVKR
ncbi:conserved hypothetical protein [Culex quinquefasciatus]|uniref:Uncharacterized protein n=1 Tax=Culex quinquefasciatus TaxID=7176 RepID=B0XJX9_CULQU|nr:conserved hypothetical protein [Culex quinquefasciatus]|eukprot:XP_001869951.1 conserved hypothetical protein [Culex quinquefasciatus]